MIDGLIIIPVLIVISCIVTMIHFYKEFKGGNKKND